jgi:hypothetical protein
MRIALDARDREIADDGASTMFSRDDVVDLERHARSELR